MPSVNLRLSDEQHAELIEVAQRENRSLQREIIYRCFGRFNQAPASIRTGSHTDADSQPRDVSTRTIVPAPVEENFKPDFKPERKKK